MEIALGALIAGLVGVFTARYQHHLSSQRSNREEQRRLLREATELAARIAATSNNTARLLKDIDPVSEGRIEDRREIWPLYREDVSWLIVHSMVLADLFQHLDEPEEDISDIGTPPADLMAMWQDIRLYADLLTYTNRFTTADVSRFNELVKSAPQLSVDCADRTIRLLDVTRPPEPPHWWKFWKA